MPDAFAAAYTFFPDLVTGKKISSENYSPHHCASAKGGRSNEKRNKSSISVILFSLQPPHQKSSK
jgi:hypothetical protein